MIFKEILQTIRTFGPNVAQPEHGYSLLSNDRLENLYNIAVELNDFEGDIAEVGVFRGGVSRLFAETSPHKTVHLFDTFEGIPSICAIDGHIVGDFADEGLLDGVKWYLSSCDNVVFHVGVFPETAKDLDNSKFSLVHLDGDTYETTRTGLDFFWPRLIVNGAIVLDDWCSERCQGVRKSIDEFVFDKGLNMSEIPMQLTIRKTK